MHAVVVNLTINEPTLICTCYAPGSCLCCLKPWLCYWLLDPEWATPGCR